MSPHHSTSYSCSCTPSAPHKHHTAPHATSSAFSASANPDEDWTKISDLAERRRIQNRIAQRNYRKKLKRRLEDLERRAASSSASPSPEQKYAQPDKGAMARNKMSNSANPSRSLEESFMTNQNFDYMLSSQKIQPEDKGMFSYQHTRQLSTSPPPLISYQPCPPSEANICGPEMQKGNYFSLPITSSDGPYLLPQNNGFAHCLPGISPSNIKQEFYEEDDINPFSLSYATMGGVDVPTTYSYQTPMALTLALSDSFDHSAEGSPEFSTYSLTPGMPLTPPSRQYEIRNPYAKL